MQISDLMGQYYKGTEAGAEKLTGTKGVENLVSSMRSLTKGNIFEGTVGSVKNGRVTLALSSGQQISARMEGKVPLKEGQSMFFQVKSNDGSQVVIRPFVMDGNSGNYTLMKALAAAGLPTESNYLSMVNKMMEEQMPIDRASLQQMARTVNLNGDIDVQTIVQLKKLGIAVTAENASQFENYLDDKQAISKQMDGFIESLPRAMSGDAMSADQMRQLGKDVLSVITEGLPEVPEEAESGYGSDDGLSEYEALVSGGGEEAAAENSQVAADAVITDTEATALSGQESAETGQMSEVSENVEDAASGQTAAKSEETAEITEDAALEAADPGQEAAETGIKENAYGTSATPHTMEATLNQEQLQNLNQMLGELLGTEETAYTGESGTVAVLKDLEMILKDSLPVDKEQLKKLFSSDEFKALVRDSLEQQWTVRPKELTDSDQINRLYDRLNDQIDRMENAMKAAGQTNTDFAQTAAEIRGNIEFMNQINEAYTYAQIPLKMSGQNASGELYVYTNKKSLAEGGDGDLTAFLHLDMDNLGSTDVSVRMHGKQVSTNFYLDSDEAFALVERNVPVLEDRLRKKGYDCSVTVINEEKHVNFVDDFLRKDLPPTGQLHRYSFDMRA